MGRRAWLLALGAIALRAAASLTVAVVESDGARNLRMAELLENGRFAEALLVRTPTPPLHPLLTVLANTLIGNLHVAGVAVSAIFGGLALVPLYWMARRAWDDRVATVTAALYAFLPAVVDFQIEPITEGTFMFFFFSAMAIGWSALEESSWERTIAAAGCAALAWLSRPEGVYLLPLFIAGAMLKFGRFTPLAIGLFLATWLILAYPYLSFIHAQTGRWQPSLSPIPGMIHDYLTGERAGDTGMDYEEYRVIQQHGKILGGARHLSAYLFGKVLFYVLGPFLVLGLFRLKPAERRLAAFLLIAAVGYLIPIALSFFASTPFSHRFLLAPASLLLPVVAVGMAHAAAWTRRAQTLPIAVAALCLAMGIRDFRPRRTDKLGMKEAGIAILKALGPGARVFATNGQILFYAKAEPVADPVEGLDAYAFTLTELTRWEPGLEERVRAKCSLLGEYSSVRVYKAKP
jgi:4-amino-4-deoxy-L-arabinose transferase-like glycosyltransferase